MFATRLSQILVTVFVALSLPVIVRADTLTFAFASASDKGLDGPAGMTSDTFLSSPSSAYTLTAYGFYKPGSTYLAHNLYEKFTNLTPAETGLGLASLPHSEIQNNSFIQFDLSKLPVPSTLNLLLSSVQAGEGYAIWGSNTLGVEATGIMPLLATGTGTNGLASIFVRLDKPLGYRFISVTSTTGDVLIENGLQVIPDVTHQTAVPLPLGLLMGCGLFGTIGCWRLYQRRLAV